jgi:hypothetical protein
MKRGDVVLIYRPSKLVWTTWYYESFEATVMGIIDGYAMLRRKGCYPFLESVKQLEKWAKKPPPCVPVPEQKPTIIQDPA